MHFILQYKEKTQVRDGGGKRVKDLGKMMPGMGNGGFVRTEGKKELAALRR